VLDYGCGKGALIKYLDNCLWPHRVKFIGYDPGTKEYDVLTEPADVVVSTDVLEHIEPECLDDVLQHIASLTLKGAYINIHTGKAKAILPDGRNAHLIQQPWDWWQAKLRTVFAKAEPIQEYSWTVRPSFVCRHASPA
jgi:cyclopropane fatty-acyl-phospholipid synthase-like methyltransferase